MTKSKLALKKAREHTRRVFGSATGLTVLAITIIFLACSTGSLVVKNGGAAAIVTASLVSLLNTDRADNDLNTLTVNPVLVAVAQAKANDMAKLGYFAHNSPEGKTPWYWFKQEGYSYSAAGENLAIDFSDSADVEKAWMNSPTHRSNLLNKNFTEVGIATAVGNYNGHKTTFVVQIFGTPAKVNSVTEPTFKTPALATEIAIATTKPVAPKVIGATTVKPEPVLASSTSESSVKTMATVATSAVSPARTDDSVESVPITNETSKISQTLFEKIKVYIVTSLGSPKLTLRHVFYLLGVFTLVAFVLEALVEIRRHHKKHVIVSVLLLLIMGSLFFIADTILFPKPILLEEPATIIL